MITLSGPAEQRDVLLDAFERACIAAHPSRPDREGAQEEAKGWVEAQFHEGVDSPSSEFQQSCMARVATVAGSFGYEHRGHGITVAGPMDVKYVVDKRTGAVVMRNAGPMPDEALTIISEEFGIPAEFLEITDPPGLWDVPNT